MYKRLMMIAMLLMIVGRVRSQNDNLLINGDFSDGLSEWQVLSSNFSPPNIVSLPSHNAAHFVGSKISIFQGIIVRPNYQYLDFYAQVNSGGIAASLIGSVEVAEILPNGSIGNIQSCTDGICGIRVTETRWHRIRIMSVNNTEYHNMILFNDLGDYTNVYISDVSLRCPSCIVPTPIASSTPHPLATQPVGSGGTINAVPGICVGNNCIDYNSSGISDRICTSGVCGTQSINAPNFPNLIVPTPRSGGSGGSDGSGTSGDYDNSEIAGLFEGALGDAEIDVGLLGINGLAIDENIFGELTLGNTTWIAYVKGFFQGQGLGAFQPLFTLLMVVLLAMLFINLTDWIIRPVSTVMGLILKVYRLLRSFIPFA